MVGQKIGVVDARQTLAGANAGGAKRRAGEALTTRLVVSLRAIQSAIGRVSGVRGSNGGAVEAQGTEYSVPGVELLVEVVS